MDIMLAGGAAVGAGVLSNPLEVLKNRMQLQGELQRKGQYAVHYRNIVHATYMIAKHDGVSSLQKGLTPALWVQFLLNGTKFGCYQMIEDRGFILDENNKTVFHRSVLAGGLTGLIGQLIVNPFFLIKIQMQTQSNSQISVGYQHRHTGMWTSLATLAKQHGIKGLFHGAAGSGKKAFIGAVCQITTFKYSKEHLNEYQYFREKPLLTSFCGSMVGGAAISIMMTPLDLITTRWYNQPIDSKGNGLLYKNYSDCMMKIFKTEGPRAFYKGIGPMYLRLGPHSVLCLVFWDELKVLKEKFYSTDL